MHYTSPEVYEFISKQTNDPIVEWKTCTVSGTKFGITQKDIEFYDKISPVFNGEKCQIPTPTLCPEERQRRRIAWRNERKLYRRKCDLTGKSIMSLYHPESSHIVYSQDAWWGDTWSAHDYANEFNAEQSFFDQLKKLLHIVPKISNLVKTSENCVYNVIMGNSKDCYLCSTTFQSESCCYNRWCVESKNCIDCSNVFRCIDCFEGIDCTNCTNILYSQKCADCSDSSFLYDCQRCAYCTLCTGLRNKKYCYKNEQYTKEEYESLLRSFTSQEWNDIKKSAVRPGLVSLNAVDCVGDNMIDCNACVYSFNLTDSTRVRYSYDSVVGVTDCFDVSMIGDQVSWMYEAHACGYGGYRTAFSNLCRTNDSLYYCDYCMSCSHCFGCVGLQNATYCILNKQYTKEEYGRMVPEIIAMMKEDGERGEFMPISMSPFGYNETASQDTYPLTKSQALERGYAWCDYEYHINIPKNAPTKRAEDLPKDITLIDHSILNQIIICEISGKPFRIVKQELDFYRKHDLPIPTKHPDVRHQERLAKRPGRKLYLRKCDKTGKEIVSVYSEEFEVKVYSEKAYEQEIYS